jgi:hypothetical protein
MHAKLNVRQQHDENETLELSMLSNPRVQFYNQEVLIRISIPIGVFHFSVAQKRDVTIWVNITCNRSQIYSI